MPAPLKDASAAAQALESTLIRQLISASGAFKGTEAAGGQMHADMFVEALADAVAKGGGMGLAKMLEKSLGPQDGSKPAAAHGGLTMPHGPELTSMPGGPLSMEAPTTGTPVVTSDFGWRNHPIDGVEKFHTGVDLRGAEGTPIEAAAAGTVLSAGLRGGYGNVVEIDHGHGVTTLYAHASAVAVQPGDHVQRGQEVAQVGQTGHATGPHLHFEVRVEGHPVDPRGALKAYGNRADIPHRERPRERP
jgi:murein DD-endopeptidase MepM/ murein hydrolase activator NlpD